MYNKEGEYVRATGTDLAKVADEALNTFGTGKVEKDFVAQMGNTHPTLQQSFTRLCAAWLWHLLDDKAWVDGRNQASRDFAKSIADQLADASFPMI